MIARLSVTQDKIKRENKLYNEEFEKILATFNIKFNEFLEAPNKKMHGMKELFLFFSQVAQIYPKEVAFIPLKLIELIENNYSIIYPEIRLAIVDSLKILRKKDLLEAIEVLPLFFKLLRCQDKILRKRLQEIIISDLTRVNLVHKNNTINQKIQNFCIGNMLTDPNKKAARKTLNIIITLFKKKIWNDGKTVNAIAAACNSTDPKIILAACRFFLSEYEEGEDSSDDEDLDELKNKYKLLGKANTKKTKSRKNKLKMLMKSIERREQRKSKVKVNKDFMPIDQLNDPTTFTEKLFSKLKNLKENFSLKLVLMRLIGRVIGRHKLYVSNFFSFMQNYINPSQKDLAMIFACIIEACHEQTPPEELEPLVNKLYDNFISEVLPAPQVTIGLNCLREVCERAPYIMNKTYLQIVQNLKDYKNKSVTNAARGVINLYKEINSNVLGIYDKDEDKQIIYGQNKVNDSIDGIELLKRHEKMPENYRLEYEQVLDDIQLKKLKVLRMKYSVEKIQNKKLNLSAGDINEMAGDKENIDSRFEEDLDLEDMEELDENDLEELEEEDLEALEDMEDEEFEDCEDEEFEDFEDEEGEDEELVDNQDQQADNNISKISQKSLDDTSSIHEFDSYGKFILI
jgi:protein SDA1